MPKQAPLLASEDDFDPQEIQKIEDDVMPDFEQLRVSPHPYGMIKIRTVANNDDGEWADVTVERPNRDEALDDFEYVVQRLASDLKLSMARPTTVITGPHNQPYEPEDQSSPGEPHGNTRFRTDRGILEIEWMQVVAKDDDSTFLKVKPKVFDYPLPDHRKPENLVKIFDPDLNVTEEYLSTPQLKPVKPKQTTYVYFVKPEKYRNIVRISYEYDENFLNE